MDYEASERACTEFHLAAYGASYGRTEAGANVAEEIAELKRYASACEREIRLLRVGLDNHMPNLDFTMMREGS